MSHACIPILVDVPSLISEIHVLLVFNFGQFSLSDHRILYKLIYMYMNNTTL